MLRLCGDLIVVGSEECEDGNFDNGDGCSENCRIEHNFRCTKQTNQRFGKWWCEGMPSSGIYGNLGSGNSTRAEQVLYENETMSIVCEPGLQPHLVDPFTNLLIPDLFGDRAIKRHMPPNRPRHTLL